MNYEAKACAKINLHLEVLNKRQDGYHNIFSLMAEVDVFDHLKLSDLDIRNDASGDIEVLLLPDGGIYRDIITGIPVKENLVSRAVAAYLERAGKSGRVVFLIEKNIPAGAGMGGGSADAAAALKLINGRLGALNDDAIMELGASLGADIPFCLTGGIALCEGKGERIEPVASVYEPVVMIVLSGIHVNTAYAYGKLKRGSENPHGKNYIARKKLLIRKGLAAGDSEIFKTLLCNDFEEPVFRLFPVLGEIKESLKEEGAEIALMTGSGSGIIGLFNDYETAQRAQAKLKKKGRQIFITTLTGKSGGDL